MKTCLSANRKRGWTLIELFVVMAVLAILAIMIYPGGSHDKARSLRVQCVNNLKQIGLAHRIWSGDCGDKYTMGVSTNHGGTMEFTTGPNAFRHFLSMSNELSTPKVLFCPAETDRDRVRATIFNPPPKPGEILFMSNSNVSYFVGVDATESDPQGILSGDHNLTNGTPLRDGILEVTTNQLAGWTAEMHHGVGNITLADGSVQQVTAIGLRAAVTKASGFTNRLQMPVLAR